ncbi:unnamed protein product [Thelazia callipaeda]|uniref:ANK_REP_REGION domain-containing protein n=1 Tax=Thelazia callipaeda TaxID=103827 RepID=A0A0N5CJ29_THECL|nr:unnamed protein product [Thelazia callipaeda]
MRSNDIYLYVTSSTFSIIEEPPVVDTILITRWIQACSAGDLRRVGELLKQKPYLISYAPAINHGFSGLHYAAKDGHSSVLRFLITNGADVNLRTSGYTPLHLAAISKQLEIISILLRDYGADPSIEDYSGYTYQHYLLKRQEARQIVDTFSKYETQQQESTLQDMAEVTQFSRLKSFRKAVHGRMRFFIDK